MQEVGKSRRYIIYKLTNTINGKCYIGQTINTLPRRWSAHMYAARHNTNKMPICRAIRKYGSAAFTREIVETGDADTKRFINDREEYWRHLLRTTDPQIGYNVRYAVDGVEFISAAGRKRFSRSRKKYWKQAPASRRESQRDVRRQSSIKMNADRKIRIARGIEFHPSAKTWEFIDPAGERISINDLTQFCREHNLNHECMRQVYYNGTQKTHRGYTRCLELREIQAIDRPRGIPTLLLPVQL